MTLHIQELGEIATAEADNMMFGDRRGRFSSQILSTDSLGSAEIERMANCYRICHFAFWGCEDAKDRQIFYRFCNKEGRRCPLKSEREEAKMLAERPYI